MKTKLKFRSRRIIALVLTMLMLFSTMMIGTVSNANAVNYSSYKLSAWMNGVETLVSFDSTGNATLTVSNNAYVRVLNSSGIHYMFATQVTTNSGVCGKQGVYNYVQNMLVSSAGTYVFTLAERGDGENSFTLSYAKKGADASDPTTASTSATTASTASTASSAPAASEEPGEVSAIPTAVKASNMMLFDTKTTKADAKSAWVWKTNASGQYVALTEVGTYNGYELTKYNNSVGFQNAVVFSGSHTGTTWVDGKQFTGDITGTPGTNNVYYVKITNGSENAWIPFANLTVTLGSIPTVKPNVTLTFNATVKGTLVNGSTLSYYVTTPDGTKYLLNSNVFTPTEIGNYAITAVAKDAYGLETAVATQTLYVSEEGVNETSPTDPIETVEGYYLLGKNFGNRLSDKNYPLQEINGAAGYYWYQSAPYELVCGSGNNFRFTDGKKFIGPETQADLNETDINANGTYFTSSTATAVVADTTSTFTCKNAPTTWDYVNIIYDSHTGQVWVVETPKRQYDIPDLAEHPEYVTILSDPVSVTYNGTSNVTVTATGFTLDGEAYNGELAYDFYQMTGTFSNPNTDTYLGTVTTNAGVATMPVSGIKKETGIYARVYPVADITAYVLSPIVFIKIEDELVTLKDVEIYIDFDEVEVEGTVTIKTMTGDGKITPVQMQKLTGTNIYKAVTEATYFDNGLGTLNSNFYIYTVTANSVEVGFTDADQPNINNLISSKTIWYKPSVDAFTNNFADGDKFKYDSDRELDIEILSYYTSAHQTYDTVRVYITNNYAFANGMQVRTSTTSNGITTATYVDMDEVPVANQYGQTFYYYDIPIDSKYIQFKGLGNASGRDAAGLYPNGHEFPAVQLSADLDSDTANAYYMGVDSASSFGDIISRGEVGLWPSADNPKAPKIVSYNKAIDMAVGRSASIMPDDYYLTLNVSVGDTQITGTTYTNSYATITLKKDASGAVTDIIVDALKEGSFEVKLTPVGTLFDTYPPSTVTVTIVNKDKLEELLANAKVAIDEQDTTRKYTSESFNDVKTAYDTYLSVYRTAHDQQAITAGEQALEDALDALVPLELATGSEFTIISYTSSNMNFVSNGYGHVTKPVTRGFVKEIDNGYSVLYAADDAYVDVPFEFSVSTTAEETNSTNSPFEYWMFENATYSTDNAISFDSAFTFANVEYVAYFTPYDNEYIVIKYMYKEYNPDATGTFEYTTREDGSHLKDAEYITAQIPVEPEFITSGDFVALVNKYAPYIVNDYFNYSPITTGEYVPTISNDNVITAYLQENVRTYTVSVLGKVLMSDCHFQQIVNLQATDLIHAEDGDTFYWYNYTDADKRVISTNTKYSFRVTENLELGVEINDSDFELGDSSVIVDAYSEVEYDDNGSQRFHQNFYVQNFFDYKDETKEYIGSGVFYYAYNDVKGKPSKSAITSSVIEKIKDGTYAESLATSNSKKGTSFSYGGKSISGLGYSYINKAQDWNGVDYYKYMTNPKYDKDVIVRYSVMLEAFTYYFNISNSYSTSMADYSYVAYSFYLYKDVETGEIHSVVTEIPATAKCYKELA